VLGLPENTPDQQLLSKAASGDQVAFQELYQRYRDSIFRFSYRLLGSVELAEDITHDCFINVVRKPRNFDPVLGSLRTYLYGAARNLALKQLKITGREGTLDDLDAEPRVAAREQPLHHLLDEELGTKVRDAIAELPTLQREALVLFEYEGLTLNEISRIVEVDVGAVKGRIFRARQRLKSALLPYLNSGSEIVTLEKALK
jgi:RNA polymerase sigma-70 factor, ECF subfamily